MSRKAWRVATANHSNELRNLPSYGTLSQVSRRDLGVLVLNDEKATPTAIASSPMSSTAWQIGDFSASVPEDSTAVLMRMNCRTLDSTNMRQRVYAVPYNNPGNVPYNTTNWGRYSIFNLKVIYNPSGYSRASKMVIMPADGGRFLFCTDPLYPVNYYGMRMIGYWVPRDSAHLQTIAKERVLGHLYMFGGSVRKYKSIATPAVAWVPSDFTAEVPEDSTGLLVDVEVQALDPGATLDQGLMVFKPHNDRGNWSQGITWAYGGGSHLVQWGGDATYFARHLNSRIMRADGGRFLYSCYNTSWEVKHFYVALRGYFRL